MINQYSFQDTGETHILYQEDMEEFDLSFAALQTFIVAIEKGDLTQIESMFQETSTKQKKGLLTLELDYSALIDPMAWGIPAVTGEKLAQYYKHNDVEKFLAQITVQTMAQTIFSLNYNKSAFFSLSDITIVTQNNEKTPLIRHY
ncbi:hypothetical protein [Legionella drancourtii]|uniref:Uncharacterized protein n=1 Tax=Legionella drancourtii LLAP12 TaxID=658187 RepID=G9EK28_9GAMM|nr:hypothetical protein [Legionella drancourtii]EHL32360.1 hypothetical protein LDG_5550 [Legionella drancourtii LLAP12]